MTEPRRDLLLLGGGHTHALALCRLAMAPPPGARITLVSDTAFAPYSGMLPGLVAGHYRFEQAHIDLRRFCGARGIRFVEAAATGIDLAQQRVHLADRPPLSWDLLSVNTGAQPELDSVPGAREFAVPVKPVGTFFRRWQSLRTRLDGREGHILVVGGGAGSVELALAMRHRLGSGPRITLLCGEQLLGAYNRGARAAVRERLSSQAVACHEYSRVSAVERGSLVTAEGETFRFDELVWCTGVVPPVWLATSGLRLDDRGFIEVEDSLQVSGRDDVFAAGDVAVQREHPRPRAGVFAVRQAPVLAHNLAAALAGRPLKAHRPQRRFLSLLSLGDKLAVADRGVFHASGGWVWRWKDRIDRRFMEKFSLPPAPMKPASAAPLMHCGGCGAKLPSQLLRAALAELAERYPGTVDLARLADDAALIDWPASRLVQTADTLRAMLDDPWLMGRVVALHALSDIYAMGAEPRSAQVHACLPYASRALQQRELFQLMAGLVCELEKADCQLVGGHSMEGPELSLGLTVNAEAGSGAVLGKSGARPGDSLILTKPLGTGVIFAAAMTGDAPGTALAAAIDSMLRSNREAARIAARHCSACTDITGFGLLGHLAEMLLPGPGSPGPGSPGPGSPGPGSPGSGSPGPGSPGLGARLSTLPALDGAQALIDAGFRSTLHAGNEQSVRASIDVPEGVSALGFDPQTSGGLLLSVPARDVEACLAQLQSAGEPAAIIGSVEEGEGIALA